MKYLIVLVVGLVPVFCNNIMIDHGEGIITRIGSSEDGLSVSTIQEHEGGLYFYKNENTGVRVRYTKPKPPSDKEVISYSGYWPANSNDYKFEFSNSATQTRQEEGKHVKDADGSETLEVKGTYSYLDSNGNQYIQGYEADKNGFRTKVAFGPKIRFSESGVKSPMAPGPKGIDGALLCSLIGGGCRK